MKASPLEPPRSGLWRWALGFAIVAAAAAILLTGVSAWFLGAVALAGAGPAALTFNFHHPGGAVRMLAITRTVAKYGERIVGHRAALGDQVERRRALFAGMAAAPETRAAGWQLDRQERLSDFLDDVEDVDFARLRAAMPGALAAAGAGALTLATAVIAPLALIALALLAGIALLLAWSSFGRIGTAWREERATRRHLSGRLGAALAALTPLAVEGRRVSRLGALFAPLDGVQALRATERRAAALIDAATAFAGPAMALAVLSAAWAGGARGEDLLPATLVAFSWVALVEAVAGLGRAMTGEQRRRIAQADLEAWIVAPAPAVEPATPAAIAIADAPLRAPDGRLLGGRITVEAQRGAATALMGASGGGKTSLLKTLAGWLDALEPVLFDATPADAAIRRASVHLGLHDAVALADSVRENLCAPGASDDDLWAALEAVELSDRIREAGGLDAWLGDATALSLGETHRLALARAWLAPQAVILLDEPGEHLEKAQGAAILERLLDRFSDRVVIFATHDPALAALATRTIRCEPGAV